MLHLSSFSVRQGRMSLLNSLLLLTQDIFISAYLLLGLSELLELLLSHFISLIDRLGQLFLIFVQLFDFFVFNKNLDNGEQFRDLLLLCNA